MEPEQKYNSEVIRTRRNAVRSYVETHGWDYNKGTYGAAPHFTTIADSVILASDYYCVAYSSVIRDHTARTEGHEILFLDAKVPGLAVPAVIDFLTEMEVYNVYKIQIYDACDLDGKFPLFTVLTAIWKTLQMMEMNHYRGFSGELFLEAVKAVFRKHEMDRKALTQLYEAATDEKRDNLHFIYDDVIPGESEENMGEEERKQDDNPKMDLSEFREKYAILHVKTNIHNCGKPWPKFAGTPSISERVREAIQEEIMTKDDTKSQTWVFGGPFTRMMVTNFMERQKKLDCSNTETICANVIESCFATNKPAFDSRAGGMTLFIDKSLLEDETILKTIGEKIFKLSGEENLTASFRPLGVAVRAKTPDDHSAEEFGEHELIQFSYQRIHEEPEGVNASPIHVEDEEDQKPPKKEEMEEHETDSNTGAEQKVKREMGGKREREESDQDEYETEKKLKMEEELEKE